VVHPPTGPEWSWQRPVRRATERNDDAVERWVKRRWPALKKGRGATTRSQLVRGAECPRVAGSCIVVEDAHPAISIASLRSEHDRFVHGNGCNQSHCWLVVVLMKLNTNAASVVLSINM
jgi:hypothetical protein